MTADQFQFLAEWLDRAQTFGKYAAWHAEAGHQAAAENAAMAAAHSVNRAHLIAEVRYEASPALPLAPLSGAQKGECPQGEGVGPSAGLLDGALCLLAGLVALAEFALIVLLLEALVEPR